MGTPGPPQHPGRREEWAAGAGKGSAGGTGHKGTVLETRLDRQPGNRSRAGEISLLSTMDPVGSGGGSGLAIGRERTGGACISESSTEQKVEGDLEGKTGCREAREEAAVVPGAGDGWERAWAGGHPRLCSSPLCPAPPALSAQVSAPGGGGSLLAQELQEPGLGLLLCPPLGLGCDCVPRSSWQECRASGGKGLPNVEF